MAQIKWKTKREIEEEKLLESVLPSEAEIKDAELEIKILKILNLLSEEGLI